MDKEPYGIHLGGTARSPKDVEHLHAIGLQFAEITIAEPKKFNDLIGSYRNMKEGFGLYYLCHGPREGDPNDVKTLETIYLPKVLDLLPIMEELSMPLLTVHLWLDPRYVKKEVICFKIQLLEKIIHEARKREITICLENLSENALHMRKPFETLPFLCLTLDLGHAQLLTDVNTSYEFIKSFPEKIKHIHLHDNRGGGSPLDDLHLPPGEGIIEFETIFHGLKQMNYKGTMTLELKTPEIDRSLEYVNGLIAQHL